MWVFFSLFGFVGLIEMASENSEMVCVELPAPLGWKKMVYMSLSLYVSLSTPHILYFLLSVSFFCYCFLIFLCWIDEWIMFVVITFFFCWEFFWVLFVLLFWYCLYFVVLILLGSYCSLLELWLLFLYLPFPLLRICSGDCLNRDFFAPGFSGEVRLKDFYWIVYFDKWEE